MNNNSSKPNIYNLYRLAGKEVINYLDQQNILVNIPEEDHKRHNGYKPWENNARPFLVLKSGTVKLVSGQITLETPYQNCFLLTKKELEQIISKNPGNSNINKYAKINIENGYYLERFYEMFDKETTLEDCLKHLENFSKNDNDEVLDEISSGELSDASIEKLKDINYVINLLSKFQNLKETLIVLPNIILSKTNPVELFVKKFLNLQIPKKEDVVNNNLKYNDYDYLNSQPTTPLGKSTSFDVEKFVEKYKTRTDFIQPTINTNHVPLDSTKHYGSTLESELSSNFTIKQAVDRLIVDEKTSYRSFTMGDQNKNS